MAHGDYDCCAICDRKMFYSHVASTKEELCSECTKALCMKGHFIGNVDELLSWAKETPIEIVVTTLSDIGFLRCFYVGEIDKVLSERGIEFDGGGAIASYSRSEGDG